MLEKINYTWTKINSTGAAEFMYAFMEVAHILIKWMKYRR